jgi:hypothetical protein
MALQSIVIETIPVVKVLVSSCLDVLEINIRPSKKVKLIHVITRPNPFLSPQLHVIALPVHPASTKDHSVCPLTWFSLVIFLYLLELKLS